MREAKTDGTSRHAACDCAGGVVPGALWPWAPNGDESLPWVEACDECRTFDSDDEAALAVAAAVDGRVMYASVAGDDEARMRPGRPLLRPFVFMPRDVVYGTPEQKATIARLAAEYQSIEVLGHTGPAGAPGLHVRCYESPQISGHAIVTAGGQITGFPVSAAPANEGQGGR